MGNETAISDVGYGAQVVASTLTVVASSLIIFVMIFFQKLQWQPQRLILSLTIANLLIPQLDLHPPFASFTHMEFCIQSGIFQGVRYAIAGLEAGILIFAVAALRTQKDLPIWVEVVIYLFSWGVLGVGAATYTALKCHQLDANYNHIDRHMDECFDLLTFAWLAIVFLSLVLYVVLDLEVRRQQRSWCVEYDPNFSSRITRELRTKLMMIQKEVVENVIRPIKIFPAIFLLTVLGEIVLVILRNTASTSCRNFRNRGCMAAYYVASLLVDLRGLFNGLAYFSDPETRVLLTPSRILARCRSRKRGMVRFDSNLSTPDPMDNDLEESIKSPRFVAPSVFSTTNRVRRSSLDADERETVPLLGDSGLNINEEM
eukprot:m.107074 g.107074  ORF g.107074 m.107074 type:complete len:372 (-) comp22563_c0_seq3:375-1490(-)